MCVYVSKSIEIFKLQNQGFFYEISVYLRLEFVEISTVFKMCSLFLYAIQSFLLVFILYNAFHIFSLLKMFL